MKKKTRNLIGTLAIIALLIGAYYYADSLLFDGVRPRYIDDGAMKASFFAKPDTQKQATVVLIGGGEWGAYWGQELAKANYVGLSLPYCCQEGLLELPEEIPLDYIAEAIDWLKEQPEVDSAKIIVMGASRNAELALLVAAHYPESVSGAIAYSPSAVSWSNTVLPYNSDSVKASWTFKNNPIPYVPMAKLQGGNSDKVETLSYWTAGLQDSTAVSKAIIQVEHIQGPILLFSGLEDAVWPSALMSDMLEERIKRNSFAYKFQNIQYKHAGHMISGQPGHPVQMRQGQMMIGGRYYAYDFGGTETGDAAAQADAAKRVFDLLSKLAAE